ncbi:PREDICTED: RING-box protein 2-like [Apaloderma vittatum]|uniref:RING-box protein 2-like n=1 Tax=Apaloderma vittatum TaxID=57397 RepID=UPI000521C4BD|nr:PREDICTED: RING-box protein 2-like [Apaloderma vittatum]
MVFKDRRSTMERSKNAGLGKHRIAVVLTYICANLQTDTFRAMMLERNPENQIESCSYLLLDACLRCQAENKQEDCVVVWGECNHSFHNCCMSLWVKQNNRCPLCQQDWVVQRIGK